MTLLRSRRNPFASNPSSPSPSTVGSQPVSSTETNGSQAPSFQAPPASAPAITLSSPPDLNRSQPGPSPQPGLDSTDLEEPPPYTPSVSVTSGETTIEVGPNRPFQAAQPSANLPRNGLSQVHNQVTPSRIPSSSSLPLPSSFPPTPSGRNVSILQQLTNSLTSAVNNLNLPSSYSTTSNYSWGPATVQPTGQSNTSYPGQSARPALSPISNPTPRNASLAPPPRHPLSPSASLHPPPLSSSTHSLPSMANPSSDFARDFYAVGTSGGEALATENIFAPPIGPPPSDGQPSTTRSALPNDGRPTSQPKPGHPLLKNGKLLIYPKGYECGKCHNVGYENAKPSKPCKPCWNKYAKPFAGPLVYSFPANTTSPSLASNFQKPLPYISTPAPPPIPTAFSSPSPIAVSAPRGYTTNHHGGLYNSPTGLIPPIPPPASGSVTYVAGDPRIGGNLCWRCGGKGNVAVLFDREMCSLCLGVGRLFQ